MVIIICIHNALKYVKSCLKSVIENTNSDYEILIIDDASNSITTKYLQFYCKNRNNVKLHRNEIKLGYTKSVNIAMKSVKSKYIVLLNSDTIVTKNWIEKMQNLFINDDNLSIVSPLSNAASFQSFPNVYDKNWTYAVNKIPSGFTIESFATFCELNSLNVFPQVDFINGFCVMIKASILEKIGIFDEKSFPSGYGEEVDYCIRLKQAGYSIRVADDTYIYHSKSKSYGNEMRNILASNGRKALYEKYGENLIESYYTNMRKNKDLEFIRLNLIKCLDDN